LINHFGREALVLFDIDGTLLRAGDPAHQRALVEAFEEVYGIQVTLEGVPLAGMLDANIVRTLFEINSIDARTPASCSIR
jgi:phosphoglycolate phosphatase